MYCQEPPSRPVLFDDQRVLPSEKQALSLTTIRGGRVASSSCGWPTVQSNTIPGMQLRTRDDVLEYTYRIHVCGWGSAGDDSQITGGLSSERLRSCGTRFLNESAPLFLVMSEPIETHLDKSPSLLLPPFPFFPDRNKFDHLSYPFPLSIDSFPLPRLMRKILLIPAMQ